MSKVFQQENKKDFNRTFIFLFLQVPIQSDWKSSMNIDPILKTPNSFVKLQSNYTPRFYDPDNCCLLLLIILPIIITSAVSSESASSNITSLKMSIKRVDLGIFRIYASPIKLFSISSLDVCCTFIPSCFNFIKRVFNFDKNAKNSFIPKSVF